MNLEKLQDLLHAEIDAAYACAAQGRLEIAYKHFCHARTLLDILAENYVQENLFSFNKSLENECAAFSRKINNAAQPAEGKAAVYIFSDSLGLPRPPEMKNGEVENSYSYLLKEQLVKIGDVGVFPHCRRYATSATVLKKINEMQGNFDHCHFIIHIGLNDAAERIFLEEQRIALDLLAAGLKDKIVGFGQKFRSLIISRQNNYTYVPLEKFRANIAAIVAALKKRDAKSLTFVNIVPMPSSTWRHTPNLMRNFARYNAVFYDAADGVDASLIDFDRLAWESGIALNLDPDMMHLSQRGHRLLAKIIFERIKANN